MSNDLAVAIPRTYGPLAKKLLDHQPDKRVPICGGLELTFRCNLACLHCYVNLPAADREAQARELSTEEWFRVIDQCADAGILWLTLTGGEPLLRPDFCEIYEYAHGKGMILSVYSNATLITERHVELWVRCPPRCIEITQYGWTRETYDQVTDAGAQYDRFQRGVRRLREAGVRVALKFVAIRANAHELAAVRDFADAEGLEFRYDTIISPRIDGGRKPLEQRLTPAEVAEMEWVDQRRADEFAQYCGSSIGERPRDDYKYQCGAGVDTIVVDPYGKMHVCQLSRRPGWDVLRDGLAVGFEQAFGAIRQERVQDSTGCNSCPTSSACSNCVGMAELESRSTDFGDPYFCQITDARAERILGADRPSPNGLVRLRLLREQAPRGDHG